jgi:hypothetical protein
VQPLSRLAQVLGPEPGQEQEQGPEQEWEPQQ